MIDWLPPGLILLGGAALVALGRGRLRTLVLLGTPLLTLWVIWQLPDGISLTAPFLGYEIELIDVQILVSVTSYQRVGEKVKHISTAVALRRSNCAYDDLVRVQTNAGTKLIERLSIERAQL